MNSQHPDDSNTEQYSGRRGQRKTPLLLTPQPTPTTSLSRPTFHYTFSIFISCLYMKPMDRRTVVASSTYDEVTNLKTQQP